MKVLNINMATLREVKNRIKSDCPGDFSVRSLDECVRIFPAVVVGSSTAHFGSYWPLNRHNGVAATFSASPLRTHSCIRHRLLHNGVDQGEKNGYF